LWASSRIIEVTLPKSFFRVELFFYTVDFLKCFQIYFK
jgi:hypothetical protein